MFEIVAGQIYDLLKVNYIVVKTHTNALTDRKKYRNFLSSSPYPNLFILGGN